MTEQPNIKREILEYALASTDEDDDVQIVNLYDLAAEREYDVNRLARKAGEIGYPFEWGVSPRVPWILDRDVVRELIDAYENEKPLPEIEYPY